MGVTVSGTEIAAKKSSTDLVFEAAPTAKIQAGYITIRGTAEIDGRTMQAKTVFDSQGKGALISGVSVALQVGNSVYIGAFQGERLVKFAWKE